MGDLVKDDKLDYAKQFLVLNFLARTRAPDEKDKPMWKWPASEKLKVVNALAGKFNDYEMYAFMAAYRYGKRFPPFSVSVEVIRLALTKKYHLA